MQFKLFNPFFLWQKRFSLIKRIKELPDDILWKVSFLFVKRGFIANYDFDKLKVLKDIHVGKTAILLGNGPSVNVKDLEKMNNYITFGCNRIHLAYDQMNFRPNYVVSSDEQMINDFGQEMVDNNTSCFFVSKKRPFVRGNYSWIKLKNGRPFKFSLEISKNVMGGGGTLISVLQIAYHMGIRKFAIYGVDHSFKFVKNSDEKYSNASGEGNHFIKNYRSGRPWQAPVPDLVEEAFVKSDKLMRKSEGYILNTTRGGKLECLERIDLDTFIDKH